MKKKFLTLAIAAIAATGFIASAQTPQNKMYSPQTLTDYAFEGVLLELPQQQRIDSLNNAVRNPQGPKMERRKVNGIAIRPDSVANDKAYRQNPAQRKNAKGPGFPKGNAIGVMPGLEYVAKVKEILTPEQFDIFMTNIQNLPDNVVDNLAPVPQMRDRSASGAVPRKAGKQCTEQNCTAGQCAGQQSVDGSAEYNNSDSKATKSHKDKKDKKSDKKGNKDKQKKNK